MQERKFQEDFTSTEVTEKFLQALQIPDEVRDGKNRISVEDFYRVRVYPMRPVKIGALITTILGLLVGIAVGVIIIKIGGPAVLIDGSIYSSWWKYLIGAVGGFIGGGVIGLAVGTVCGAVVSWNKPVLIKAEDVFEYFTYHEHKDDNRLYCTINCQ